MKRVVLLFIIVILSTTAFGQKDKKAKVNDENFKQDDLPKVLLTEINKFRKSKGLDTLEMSEMLSVAAMNSAESFADSKGQPRVEAKQTRKNLKYVGATKKGEELAMNAPISKGRDNYKTEDVAKTIYNRWENNKKEYPILLNPKYVLVGISCALNEEGKKVTVSAVFGGYDIRNEGVEMKKELAVPFNTKSKKLKDPDLKSCKNCDKWKKYDVLQQGLYVANGKVYLKYNNIKELKRLLKKSKDGLAVDIVQRAQYSKPDYNIMDNNLYNKGVMNKVIYKDKLFSKNLIKPDPKAKKKVKINKLEVEMGKFNTKIDGPYELNLIVVQDGHVCRTVTRSYLENSDPESNTPIGILPAPDTKGIKPPFEPRSESSLINFTIPFAKNKSEFKNEDIQPLINALKEPDFIIEGLYIYAYSSIEGDSVANAKLQRKRAESVSNVLLSRQTLKVKPSIETKDSWGLFILENDEGKYAELTTMGKRKAIDKINGDKKLMEELEPILAKERFAQVIMDVTYDISGNKEQKFSNVAFFRALKAGNDRNAFKIMEYIHNKVAEKKYSAGALDSLDIPNEPKYVNLMNNKVHYRFLENNNTVDEDDQDEIERLYKMDPNNDILKYNKLYCAIKLDSSIGDLDAQSKTQQQIDELYKTKIDKKYLDGLNIEFQFRLMDVLDTSEAPAAQAAVEACIARIKSFYDLKQASWQNAQKLAFVFSRAKDFRYAANILEPYVVAENVDKNLLFSYISIASHLPEKFYSRT
ncbi:MAG: CAP domain-containing protein, partial [Bacteroidia bacterium]